jgi:tetratricopeptide (TPR) repeat protein
LDIERYARVKTLFGNLCDLPEQEREAHLAGSGEDADVIAQVRVLLAREQMTTRHIERPIVGMLGEIAGDECEPGDVLGAWTLARRIGHGGMGSVFLARRSDGHFEQTAAIKVLRGLPSADALEHLARERQILARLTHPNIARLLDGGATPNGQPYLVLDYVDGMPIDDYCTQNQLAPDAILRLLANVCAAVGFAHQRLIVHCDLKPSNILVDSQGRPQLLDFGIARLLQHGSDSAPAESTRAFTPGYASPEQREGGSVSTAADVYGIGRMMIDLLGRSTSTDEKMAREPARIADRELAAIATKATADDPARRYATVDALEQDIQRHLTHQPLQAMPSTAAYRTRKFLRRRWPWVATAAAFLLVVAGFTLRVVADRDRAEQAEHVALKERDRAVQAQESARRISQFLTSMLEASHPDAGSGEVPTSKLVEQALARIDTELDGQPAAQAELYGTLAGVQKVLGNMADARTHFDRAIAIQRTLDDPLRLADLLTRRSLLLKAAFGKPEALVDAREVFALTEHRVAPDSAAMADALDTLGTVLYENEKFDEAEPLLLRALAIQTAIDPQGDGTVGQVESLGLFYQLRPDYPRSIEYFQRELAIRTARDGADHLDTLSVQESLGATYGLARQFDLAEKALRSSLDGHIKHGEGDSAEMAWRYSQLGRVVDNAGRSRDALPLYREAVRIGHQKIGVESVGYGVLLNNFAVASRRVGSYADAERAYAQAVPILQSHWTAENKSLNRIRTDYGTLLMLEGKLEAAHATILAAYEARVKILGAEATDTTVSETAMAEWERRSGQVEQAWARVQRISGQAEKLEGTERAEYLHQAALARYRHGERAAALLDLQAAEQKMRDTLGDKEPRTWLAMLDRADLLVAAGTPESRLEGAALAREILAKVDNALMPESALLAQIKRLAAAR